MTVSRAILVIAYAAWCGQALWMLIAPGSVRRRQVARFDRAVAARLARGRDRYFDELRTIRAYRQPHSLRRIQIGGAAMLGLAALVLLTTDFR